MRFKRVLVSLVVVSLLAGLLPATCSSGAPVRLLLDTDMSGDCDDVGAVALLHALTDRGECELLATIVNRKDLTGASAAATDVITRGQGSWVTNFAFIKTADLIFCHYLSN